MSDDIKNPAHYTQHPSGVECITIAQEFNFNLGNVIKYVWRADKKGGCDDLLKAREYIDYELARRKERGIDKENLLELSLSVGSTGTAKRPAKVKYVDKRKAIKT